MVSSRSITRTDRDFDSFIAMPPILENLMESIRNIPCDRETIPQTSLDLTNKNRSSLFPWRGQFSPEFVEIILDTYSRDKDCIFDPFVGSGSTLFECTRKRLRCFGSEINPSAVEMAKTVQFASVPLEERRSAIQEAEHLIEKYVPSTTWNLFSSLDFEQHIIQSQEISEDARLRELVHEARHKPAVHNLIANAIIRYLNDGKIDILRALYEHAKIVENLLYSPNECNVFYADARVVSLPSNSVDLIITSPPYINVFNYHQNNRPAMELLGWDILEVAKSEIGSNRKHRQNRFLTVIQYALDMLDALKEMRRVLTSNGRAIIVVGRESSVRGARFKNGMIVALLASGGVGFRIDMLQERKFMNKFGEIIFEDILHLVPCENARRDADHLARSVATWSLQQALHLTDGQVKNEIIEAIERVPTVQKSPILNLSLDKVNNSIEYFK